MKRLFFVLFIIIFFSFIVVAQPQLENIDNDFRIATDVAKKIVAWFFFILIVIFGIGATAMNLNRKKDKKFFDHEP